MGEKGAKLSQDASDICERMVQDLAPLGDVSSRKMFGGYGVFESDAMFALIDSKGGVFLKVDDTNRARFESVGAKKHGRMPYYQPPSEVFEDDELLRDWASASITIAHASKKK
jgi:DNA transformation protein